MPAHADECAVGPETQRQSLSAGRRGVPIERPLSPRSSVGQSPVIRPVPARQPSTRSGRYWLCLSLHLTARLICTSQSG